MDDVDSQVSASCLLASAPVSAIPLAACLDKWTVPVPGFTACAPVGWQRLRRCMPLLATLVTRLTTREGPHTSCSAPLTVGSFSVTASS